MEDLIKINRSYLFHQEHTPVFLTLAFLFIIYVDLQGQCIDTANFNNWRDISQQDDSWTVLSPVEVEQVEESIPPVPNFFVSNQEFINVRFAFDLFCMTSPDQDFIGFTVGYKSPANSSSNEYDCILFDWKAKSEVAFTVFADEGFTLTDFHGEISPQQIPRYFWGHNGVYPNSICTPFVHSYGESKGWQSNKNYHFEVSYTTGNITIEINGEKIFDVDRCNQSGKIGFYTYSQNDVIFSNFTWRSSVFANVDPVDICPGDSVFYTIEDPLCGGYNPLIENWQWDFGDGYFIDNKISGYHTYNSGGTFPVMLIASFPGECTDTVILPVHVKEPVLVDLGPDTTLEVNSGITLTAGPDQYGWQYSWSNGSGLNEIVIQNLMHDTTIWVIVTKNQCSGYDEINIHIAEPPPPNSLFVPNAFSPDGDGLNDQFIPVFKEELPEQYSLVIYNRWGQEIFDSTNPAEGWDGRVHQKDCPGDIYVYLVKYSRTDQNLSPETIVKKGTLMLVR